jgi:hypothetical protein
MTLSTISAPPTETSIQTIWILSPLGRDGSGNAAFIGRARSRPVAEAAAAANEQWVSYIDERIEGALGELPVCSVAKSGLLNKTCARRSARH